MAKIWFAHDGENPTTAEAKYERSLQQCAEQLGLSPRLRYCGLNQNPAINDPSPLPQDYQHVICRVDSQEASAEQGWEAGFYRLRFSKEVAKRLGAPGVAP